jgi:hypothetical protein
MSLWLDVKIFFKTIQTVIKKENLYTNTDAATEQECVAPNAEKANHN